MGTKYKINIFGNKAKTGNKDLYNKFKKPNKETEDTREV